MPINFSSTELGGITNLALLAPIKEGFVDGLDTCSYVKRLELVLKTLNALALASREAQAQSGSADDDFVGRMRIVHFFRFTIVPPESPPERGLETAAAAGAVPSPGRYRLLLNVTFDGGWEPYMRVIWRDLGTTLDLMLCNCVDYPWSHDCTFEAYVAWVRRHEVQGGFFYADSALSVVDQRFLARAHAERVRLDTLSAPVPPAGADLATVAFAALRPMAALFALAPIFSANAAKEEGILLRAAHDILRQVQANALTQTYIKSPVRERFARMLAWFEQPRQVQAPKAPGLPGVVAQDVQGGILKNYAEISWGCLVLLRVIDADPALQALSTFQVTTAADAHDGPSTHCNLALTFAGLRALRVPASQLDRFPQEFIDGMAARAGVLGDVRCNHPGRWSLPERHSPGNAAGTKLPPVDLDTVHVVVQLRRKVAPADATAATAAALAGVAALLGGKGFEVLSIQMMVRYPEAGDISREHFGFRDGFSQPQIATKDASKAWDDAVPAGEILLGHANERGDGRVPTEADALFDNGTFLVVRKLRQDVGLLRRVVAEAASALWPSSAGMDPLRRADQEKALAENLLNQMMGRTPNGAPLVSPAPTDVAKNDFNYSRDVPGALCPFQSHVRRSNPRKDLPMPRIVRRGMSYGARFDDRPDDPRGIFFMAYSASIAEQFEKIQRWISGSTPSGGFSGQSDPLLGVPDPGHARPFGLTHNGKSVFVDLGSQPFASLEWGLYLFVPSVTGLKTLGRPLVPPRAEPHPAQPTEAFIRWQRLLEDGATREAAWKSVRDDHRGLLRTAYGVLVADLELVMEVFSNQQNYSVRGYGQRMASGIGVGYLGLDSDTGHDEQASGSNAAIAAISEREAFVEAHAAAAKYLKDALDFAQTVTHVRQATIDIGALGESVLATLCTTWFGFPDGKGMIAGWSAQTPPAQCPAHFFAVSRYVFGPRPSQLAQQAADGCGKLLKGAVGAGIGAGIGAGVQLGKVALGIKAAIEAIKPNPGDADLVARTVVGAMLGFPPTVFGNLRNVAAAWLQPGALTNLQNDLLAWPAQHAGEDEFGCARAVLRKPLVATMLTHPVPDMLWRTARRDHTLGALAVHEGEHIVIGILSASQQVSDPASPEHYVMFGGDAGNAAGHPLHACPGYGMAMGTLLGIFSALLGAGALRPAGGLAVRLDG